MASKLMAFGDYLDRFSELKELKNDSRLAEYFGVSRAYVNQWRARGNASDEVCLAIAEVVGAEPAIVIIARNRAKDPSNAWIWESFLKKVAIFTLAGVVIAGSDDSLAQTHQTSDKDYRKYKFTKLLKGLRLWMKSVSSNYPKTACPTLATR